MFADKINISDRVSNQLPEFIRDEDQQLVNFLFEYYKSQEKTGRAYNVLNNLLEYLDIDAYDAETSIAQEDLLVFSDNNATGTEKKITFSNFEDQIFSNINTNSSYLTVAAGGGISIDNLAITNGMLAGSIENAKLSNSAITIGTTSISLGDTSTTLSGINELTVDNIKIDGNSITTNL